MTFRSVRVKVLGVGIAAGVLVLAGCASPKAPGEVVMSPAFAHGPYKDLMLASQPASFAIVTETEGRLVPVVETVGRGTTVTWAFALGECGSETLAGLEAQKIAAANIPAFEKAGIDFIVSSGGQGGLFTCDTDAGMEAFLARYASPRFFGVDFDIEAEQTPPLIESLIARAAFAQQAHPTLRFSFTLPTLAASDGSRRSLVEQGMGVLESIRRHGLRNYTINLMTMDYGPPTASNCVVRQDEHGRNVCDMGRSAVQAAENLHSLLGVAYEQIELTPMIGVNDAAANDFHPADFELIGRYAREKGLAGVHFWSLDRDKPCARLPSGASSACSGMPDVAPGAFARALAKGLR